MEMKKKGWELRRLNGDVIPWNKGKTGVFSKETLERMSKSHKENYRSEEFRRKNSLSHMGFIPSQETRDKLSKALKGRIFSETHRKNLSLANKKVKHSPCSEEIKLKISKTLKGRIFSIETRKKLSEGQTGEKNHKWIKDRTKLKRYGSAQKERSSLSYSVWVRKVKERDRNKCRLLSVECNGRIETHHLFNWLDYPGLRYIINNGITLCAFHHPRGREKEERMIPILQELLTQEK